MRKCKHCQNTARVDSDMCFRCEQELERLEAKARMREALITTANVLPPQELVSHLLDYIDGNYHS